MLIEEIEADEGDGGDGGVCGRGEPDAVDAMAARDGRRRRRATARRCHADGGQSQPPYSATPHATLCERCGDGYVVLCGGDSLVCAPRRSELLAQREVQQQAETPSSGVRAASRRRMGRRVG